MSIGNANCAVCGAHLEYFSEAQSVTCETCGKQETGHSICSDGHYVCDMCHRKKGVDLIMERCRQSAATNPIELAQSIMSDKSIYPNGPEHHSLVGAVLLCAYRNAGGEVDLDKALDELRRRSLQVPGGTCGFWGTCGAAVSAGQFFSIVSGSTPMTQEPWVLTQRLTSRILGRMADIGGPRCCKRCAFIAIDETVDYVRETYGISMDKPASTVCTFMSGNAECRGLDCPFFPSK